MLKPGIGVILPEMDDIKIDQSLSVYTDTENEALTSLARQLNVPLIREYHDIGYILLKRQDKLYLQGFIDTTKVSICVDFLSDEANYRREQGSGKRQPIARAIGMKASKTIKVLDATAGLGGDAFVLACLGCELQMLERSPIIASLLADGLRRALLDDEVGKIACHMTLQNMNAENYFAQLIEKPDVIYLDPMYPGRKKTAKVKKEMQMLQGLLAHQENGSLLKPALEVAKERVVVKRPKGAEHLENVSPNHSIESKKTRYDVYLSLGTR